MNEIDPPDWAGLHSTAYQIIDDAKAHVRDVRHRPLCQDMPDSVRNTYAAPLSIEPWRF